MAYYTKVLLPDETVRAVGRLHWAIYLRAWLLLLIALIAGFAYLDLHGQGGAAADWPATLAAVVGVVFLVTGLLHLFGAWVRRSTTEIAVTDRRIISKVGFIRRRTMEMNMNKVETVDVAQSIPGRIFNYGTIVIRGTGSTYEPLRLIANPITLRTAIIAQ